MARITGSYPDDLDFLIEGAVEAGVFGGKSDALREYFEDHETERIAAAVALYKRERITLGDAARLADVDRWTMRDILRDHGVELRLGLTDEDDAAHEVEAASELEFDEADSDDEEPRAK